MPQLPDFLVVGVMKASVGATTLRSFGAAYIQFLNTLGTIIHLGLPYPRLFQSDA